MSKYPPQNPVLRHNESIFGYPYRAYSYTQYINQQNALSE